MGSASFKFIPFMLCVLLTQILSAQPCGSCKETPSVAVFDLQVQVPQPQLEGDSTKGWLEWLQLFWMGRHAAARLFQQNKQCIKFMQPIDATASTEALTTIDGIVIPPLTEESAIMKVGMTYTHLAPPGNLSRFGDYLVTGYINSSGNGYLFHLEVQTSCSRKVVASADVPFQLSSSSQNSIQVGQQAASQLSPLIEKIKNFEKEEKVQNKHLSLFQMSPGEPIKITPQKNSLKSGESTEITIELKDCDGTPVAGRDILFTETEFEGFKIHGTIGGIVSPAKVTTDANGRAKAKFTLQPGAKEAIINAHSPGENVKGCSSMFIGDAAINIVYNYSGYVKYSLKHSVNCSDEKTSGCLHTSFKGKEDQVISYVASFYQDNEKGQDVEIYYDTKEEDDQNPGNNVPNVMETGNFDHKRNSVSRGVIVCESVNKGQETVQTIQQTAGGKLKNGSVRFSFSDNFGSVNLHIVFDTKSSYHFKQTLLPSQSSTSSEETSWDAAFDTLLDKNLTAKKEKAGARTKYTVEGSRSINANCVSTEETIKMVVWEE